MQQVDMDFVQSPRKADCKVQGRRDFTHWISALLLMLAAIAVMFHPVIFSGKTLMIGAAHCSSIMPGGAYTADSKEPVARQFCPDPWAEASQGEAWFYLTGQSYLLKQKPPLWNMYSGCGMPFLANMQTQTFYPPTVLMSIFRTNLGYEVFVLDRLLVAGLCTYFALRMLVSARSAALTGAIAYMFSGYILRNLNMADISVDVVIPALILGVEAVIQRPGILSISLCAAAVASNLFGGMPEISFISLAFSGWYVLVRLLTLNSWRIRVRVFGLIAIAYAAGLLISLPQVLPFLEYMRLSDNLHDPKISGLLSGLEFDQDWRRGLLSYIVPGGWAQKYYASGFYGAELSFLAFLGVSVAGWRLLKKGESHKKSRMMVFFFAVAMALMVLKRFGSPIVQWIGNLPVANMVLYAKYDEILMSLCVAALASYGASRVQKREIKPRTILALAIIFWMFVTILCFLYKGGGMIASFDLPSDMGRSIELAAGALCASVVLCLASYRSRFLRRTLPVLLIVPFMFETYHGYMTQTFYGNQGLVDRLASPYDGAPYINFLKRHADQNSRVMGLDGVLHPNWSGVFNIQDVRYSDALCPSRYNALIASLLPNSGFDYRGRGINGTENSMYDQFRLRRLCDLTSARYLLCIDPLKDHSDLIVSNAQRTSPYSSDDSICYVPSAQIDGVKQPVLFQHPNATAPRAVVGFEATVPNCSALLEFDFVRNPDVACPARRSPIYGVVEVKPIEDSSPPLKFSFSNSESAKLHAVHYSFDLAKFSGKRVWISLESRTEPGSECSWEWVGWKKMRFCERDDAMCIYDREIKIYELPKTIPHAAVFTAAKVVEDTKVLSELQRRSFSPQQCVLFSRSDLSQAEARSLAELSFSEQCRPARISKYESDNLDIELPVITSPSLLLLTDNCFPGWRAIVDGREQRILRGNHCFRAVLLPVGARTVRFEYDPWPFKVGVWLSVLTITVLTLVGLRSWSRRRRGK